MVSLIFLSFNFGNVIILGIQVEQLVSIAYDSHQTRELGWIFSSFFLAEARSYFLYVRTKLETEIF